MIMKKYKFFLFDADGTLFDYDMAEENALRTMFKMYGLGYSEDIRQKYREINSQVWKDYDNGKITKDALQVLRFRRLFEETGIDREPGDFNKKYLYELGKGSFLIDGALEICKEITGCNGKIFIVTNGILATQQSRIKHSPINKYISDYFVSEHIGYAKPHPLYFEYVFSHILQFEKNKCLIIGDNLATDITGGNNAGIDSCWFNRTGTVNDTGIMPVFEINDLRKLGDCINRY